jgi:hypothetical protein
MWRPGSGCPLPIDQTARSTLQHVGTGEPSKIHSLDFILVVVDIEGEIPIDSRE